jgi:HD-like signal output (HDOD) protein
MKDGPRTSPAEALLREAEDAASAGQWEISLARAETALHLGSVDHRGPSLRLRALEALSAAALVAQRPMEHTPLLKRESRSTTPPGRSTVNGVASLPESSPATPFPRGTVEQFVERAEALAPFPAIATQILAATDDDGASAHDLARWISSDPTIAASVLRLANSAQYHRSRHVETVREAVVLLGAREVRSLAVASVLMSSSAAVQVVNYQDYWRFALMVGFLAELQAVLSGKGREVAFTAGVVQDIGLIALDLVDPDGLRAVLQLAPAPGRRRLEERESSVFGFSSADLGMQLVARWGFPESLVRVVEKRHARLADLREQDQVVEYVVKARIFARSSGLSDGVEQSEAKRPPEEWTRPPLAEAIERVGGIDGLSTRIDELIAA